MVFSRLQYMSIENCLYDRGSKYTLVLFFTATFFFILFSFLSLLFQLLFILFFIPFFLFILLYDYISFKKWNLANLPASKEAAIAWAREHRLLRVNKNCGVHRKSIYEGVEHEIGRFRCFVGRGKYRQYARLIYFLMKFACL